MYGDMYGEKFGFRSKSKSKTKLGFKSKRDLTECSQCGESFKQSSYFGKVVVDVQRIEKLLKAEKEYKAVEADRKKKVGRKA